jgi:chloramphenicol 3-O phosphotransferase
MKKILLLCIVLVGIGGAFVYFRKTQATQKSKIIILNGASASGKSSIQTKLMQIMPDLYLKIGIDNFFVGVLPTHYVLGSVPEPKTPEDVVMKGIPSHDAHGPLFTLVVGPKGQKVICGMHQAIAAYAQCGNNIVVDYILYDKAWLKDLVKVLKDFTVYFVGVDIPLDVLEAREKARATSPVGHARSHYDIVHSHNTYDIRVDTSKLTAEECAEKIKQYVENNPNPQAFKNLYQQL